MYFSNADLSSVRTYIKSGRQLEGGETPCCWHVTATRALLAKCPASSHFDPRYTILGSMPQTLVLLLLLQMMMVVMMMMMMTMTIYSFVLCVSMGTTDMPLCSAYSMCVCVGIYVMSFSQPILRVYNNQSYSFLFRQVCVCRIRDVPLLIPICIYTVTDAVPLCLVKSLSTLRPDMHVRWDGNNVHLFGQVSPYRENRKYDILLSIFMCLQRRASSLSFSHLRSL